VNGQEKHAQTLLSDRGFRRRKNECNDGSCEAPTRHHFLPLRPYRWAPVEEMVNKNVRGEEWQRQMTIEWVKRIKAESLDHAPVILDGQTRQSFIEEACRLEGLSDYKIVLFHCEDAVRDARVIARGHPELANSKMANWAKHLRQWALYRGDAVIDTTALTMEEAADELQRQISIS
jgi:hypothetical protein